MKILHIHDTGYRIGGAEVVVSCLVEGQRNLGHDVRVLTSFHLQNTFATDTYNSSEKTVWDKCIGYTWNREARRAAKKLYETFQPDIVHLHSITKTSTSVLSVFKQVPIVMTIHNFGIIDPTRIDLPSLASYGKDLGDYFVFHAASLRFFIERLRHKSVIRKELHNVSLFLPSSRFMQSVIHEYEPTWASQVLRLGISLYTQHPLPKSIVFLGIGRFIQEKGFDHLIEAFSFVVSKLPQARLMLVGDGNESVYLKELIIKRGLVDNVTWFSCKTDRSMVENYYKQSLIVVIPSLWPEPFGLVGIEALSVGRPVIAYDVGGVREWLRDGINGILVPRGDIRQLAMTMINLASDPKRIHAMIGACIDSSKEFSLDAYRKRMENVYHDVISMKIKNRDLLPSKSTLV